MTTAIDRTRIQALIPHQGAMCLWDEVLAWDPQSIQLAGQGHRDPAHPLRSGDRLHAVHLCEYGAQAMAVHGGLLGEQRGAAVSGGLLVALRDVRLQLSRIDDLPDALQCTAEVLALVERSHQYRFVLTHRRQTLAEGRAMVMLQPR